MPQKKFSTLLSCLIVISGIFSVSIIAPDKTKASSYNHLAQLPLMGWSSWSSIRKNPTEEKIKAAADIIADKFKSHGYEYINLDDYYQLNWTNKVDPYGRWAVDPEKFPHGMKALGDYIHKKGLKFGLYVTLGIPKGAIDQNTPIEGTPYHAKDIVDLRKGQKVNFNFKNMYSIDYSKPGAQEYIDSWAKLFASYGVDFLKIDGVRNQDIPDIKAWAKALKKTGRPIHVELSNNLDIKSASTWKQLSNGWRTDHDVEAYGKSTITDWEHVSRRFSQAARWYRFAGMGGWNDFDALNVANGSKDGLSNDEKRSCVSLWAIAASHFVIGSDLTKLDDFGMSLLTNDEIIGANQSGTAGKRLYSTATSQVFYQTLSDGSYNIALFNTGEHKQDVSVQWSKLGFSGSAFIHDMWSHQDLGSFDTGFTSSLSAHASQMIHAVPASTMAVSPRSGETGIDPSKLILNWEPQFGTVNYHILVATDRSFTKLVTDQIVSLSKLKLDHLSTNTGYYWKVSSLSNGIEKNLGIYSFHTKMTSIPSAPDWVIAKRNEKKSVFLTWNPAFGSASYTVYRKELNLFGDNKYTPIASNLTDPNYVDKTALKGVKYSYQIAAINEIGESEKSLEAVIEDESIGQMGIPFLIFLTLIITIIMFGVIRTKRNRSNKYEKTA